MSVLVGAAKVVSAVGEAIRNGRMDLTPAQHVVAFDFDADQPGKITGPSDAKLFHVEYATQDLKQASYAALDLQDILNMAQVVQSCGKWGGHPRRVLP